MSVHPRSHRRRGKSTEQIGALLVAMIVIISACSSSSGGASTAASAAASTAASAAASVAAQARRRVLRRARRQAPKRARCRASTGASAGASNSGATLLIWADQKRAAAITPLAQQWATENGVTVKVESIASDIVPKFKTASQAGNPPDVVGVWAHDVIGDLVQNGAIDPIQGLTDTFRLRSAGDQGNDVGGEALTACPTQSRT